MSDSTFEGNVAPTAEETVVSSADQLLITANSSSRSADELNKVVPRKTLIKHKKPNKLQKILKPKQPIVKRYFTAGTKINENNAKDLSKEPSPFQYPKAMEEFAHKVLNNAWRDDERIKELKKKYYNRHSTKEKQNMDLLNRLYVKDTPTEDVFKTMVDINPNYYKVVQGRPFAERLDIRKYIDTVRDTLRTKIVIGFREDDIMQIDEGLTLEQEMIDIVKENLQSYINTFEDFLREDHSSAMILLKESEEIAKDTYDKYLQLNAVSQKYASLNSSLYNLEEKWRLCKTYQKFLHSVSPMSWRMHHSSKGRASIYVMQKVDDDFAVGAFRRSVLAKGLSVHDIIEEFKEATIFESQPELYFTKPDELMDVFRFMEMQNLNSLLHSEELAKPLERLKTGMKVAVEAFDRDIKNLNEIINVLEEGILWEENSVKYLEELATQMIRNEFKNLIIDEDILNLQVIVEDLYESRIGPNDANINCVEMMKAVEKMYRQELLFFDKIPSREIARLEGSYYEEEIMMMKLAERAAKDYAEMERITNNLKRALEPPKERKPQKELKKRTAPQNPPKKVIPPPRSLTQDEEDYLEYFTHFCKDSDDPKKYGIDTSNEASTSLLIAKISTNSFAN